MRLRDAVSGMRASFTVLALAFAAAAASPSWADAVDDAVKSIAELDKAGDDAACVAKMQEFKDSDDPRILAALRGAANSSNDKIACAAIRQAAGRKDPKLLPWLRSKVGDEGLRTREKGGRPEVWKCVVETLASYRDPGALKPLAEAVDEFLSSDAEYATLAIRAYGSVPQKPVVAQLIEWLGELEQSHGGKSSGGRGGKVQYGAEAQKVRDKSRSELNLTLIALTDEDLGDYAAWKKWWGEKAGGFRFPPPDAHAADADVTKLAEWTDTRYGYKIVRPDGEGWGFRPGGEWFRIQLVKADSQGVMSVSVGWNVFNTAGKTIKDVREYAAWWAYEQFPKNEFEDFEPGGSPAFEERMIRGWDWTVVTAKGRGKGALASWGPMERRVYITKLDHRLLYAWIVVRVSAPPEDKQKAWDSVERVIVVPK